MALLRGRHGIALSTACVRRIMIDAGFWVPRKQRPPRIHQRRNRRACLGELVQIDGSDHPWFEDRAPACTLLVYVDDATGRLMQLLFAPTETTQAYFVATRAYVEPHGKPLAFYSDKAGIFRVNARDNAEGRGLPVEPVCEPPPLPLPLPAMMHPLDLVAAPCGR